MPRKARYVVGERPAKVTLRSHKNWWLPVCPICIEVVTDRQAARLAKRELPSGRTTFLTVHRDCR